MRYALVSISDRHSSITLRNNTGNLPYLYLTQLRCSIQNHQPDRAAKEILEGYYLQISMYDMMFYNCDSYLAQAASCIIEGHVLERVKME